MLFGRKAPPVAPAQAEVPPTADAAGIRPAPSAVRPVAWRMPVAGAEGGSAGRTVVVRQDASPAAPPARTLPARPGGPTGRYRMPDTDRTLSERTATTAHRLGGAEGDTEMTLPTTSPGGSTASNGVVIPPVPSTGSLNAPTRLDASRRVSQPLALGAIPAAPTLSVESRRLLIGREITLTGDISTCDTVLIEGTVEAKLREARYLEISEAGIFKGSAEVDDAVIAGRFEGQLVVRGRLRIRAGGTVEAEVRYGELEVEAGGRVIGNARSYDPADTPANPTE